MHTILFDLCAAYLIGAIPTGYLFSYLYGSIDIRRYGSGNIGASNVARVFGPLSFMCVFLIDAGKAYLFMLFLKSLMYNEYSLLLCAFILLLGNMYSIFLQGDGGKGVATYVGLVTSLQSLYLGYFLGLVWFFVLGITRIPAYASLAMVWMIFLYGCMHYNQAMVWFLFISSLLISMRHRFNIMKGK